MGHSTNTSRKPSSTRTTQALHTTVFVGTTIATTTTTIENLFGGIFDFGDLTTVGGVGHTTIPVDTTVPTRVGTTTIGTTASGGTTGA